MRRNAVWLLGIASFVGVFLLCLWRNAAFLDELFMGQKALAAPVVCTTPSYLSMTREGRTVTLRGRVAGERERRQLNEAIRPALGSGGIVVDALKEGGVSDEGLVERAAALWPLFRDSGQHMWLGREGSLFIGRAEDEIVKAAIASRFAEANRSLDTAVSVTVDPSLAVEKAQKALDELMTGTIIEFEVASTIIRRDSLKVLDLVALRLLQFPQVKLRIAGHTDGLGDRWSNRQLSLARANAVRSYIASRNVAPARLVAEGYGSERPVASNATAEGRRENRRIAFVVFRESTP